MKTHELILPASAQGMSDLAMDLTLEARALAAKHGLTIDGGGKGAHASLPKGRLNFILLGGRLLPRGGMMSEKKRTVPFLDRARDFARELFQELQLIQVMGIGTDLHHDYDVEIRLDSRARSDGSGSLETEAGMVQVAETTADAVANSLVLGGDVKKASSASIRDMAPILTWKITRRRTAH